MKLPQVNQILCTMQEKAFMGGSFADEKVRHPYTPSCVLEGSKTIAAAQAERKTAGYFTSQPLGSVLGLPGNAVFTYEQLDPQTGETRDNPHVVGHLSIKREIILYNPEKAGKLTTEAYRILREAEQKDPEAKYFLRENPPHLEKEQTGSGGIETE